MKWDKTLKILILHCPNLNALKDSQGDTLLHKAVSLGNTPFARILMNAGIDLSTENRFKATPMDQAVKSGKFTVVKELIYDYEGSRYSQLLDYAIEAGQKKIVDFLLSICG